MSTKYKNILFLTSHLPYPAISGGRLREYEIIKRLANKYNVYLIVVTKTFAQDLRNFSNIKHLCKEIFIFASYDKQDKLLLSNNFPKKIIRIISSKAQTCIDNLINNNVIDLIYLENYYMFYFLHKGTTIPTIIAAQNIESELIKQELRLSKDQNIKLQLAKELEKSLKYEFFYLSCADMCIALTKDDYKIIKNNVTNNKVRLIQNGYDHICFAKTIDNKINIDNKNSLVITGNFQYKPNIDAAHYFINDIFPLIQNDFPNVILYVVGNNPGPELKKFHSDNIQFTGRVENIVNYIIGASIFVCPLRIGGGIKAKMLEAIYCNSAIVTTSIGAQGLKHLKPRAFIIADNAKQFAMQVISLLRSTKKIETLKNNTNKILKQLTTWQKSFELLDSALNELLIGTSK